MTETARCGVVIVAAGAGKRAGGVPKALIPYRGGTLLSIAIETALSVDGVERVAVACVPGMQELLRKAVGDSTGKVVFVDGGAERYNSVESAVSALPADLEIILIHDVARPRASAELYKRVISGALKHGAAIPAVDPADTVKVCESGVITGSPDRRMLKLAQTPQGFRTRLYMAALKAWEKDGRPAVSDDASLVERLGVAVFVVEGERMNTKVTWPEDVKEVMQEGSANASPASLRIGHGWDLHRITSGRPLILGGARFDCGFGLLGHSDADVLAHAIVDAILGALGLGDIGTRFPDSDPAYHGADSMMLLGKLAEEMIQAGYKVGNVDCTVITEKPKISPRAREIAGNIAGVLRVDSGRVGVKAKTAERLGAEGEGLAISAHAVVLLEKV